MRASPSVRLAVAVSSRWRLAVSLWGASLALVLVYWAIESATLTGAWVWPVAIVAAAFGGWVTRQMLTLPPVTLAWDGQYWRCAPAGAAIDEAPAGTLQVCLDLGGWMLVRHVLPGQLRGTWIPVQSGRHDPSWHLFRCAVYSARPEVGGQPHDSTPGASRRTDTAA